MRTNRKYQLYLNAMPEAANEGLLRLMSKGKPLVKKYTLTHIAPNDIFSYQSFDTHMITNNDLEIQGGIVKAYYFEINNNATIEIQQYDESILTWETLNTINHVANVAGSYEIIKDIIQTDKEGVIRLVFKKR